MDRLPPACQRTAFCYLEIVAIFLLKRERAVQGSPWGHLMAGAVAGAASRTAVAPLETLRLQAMVG
jgi:hypothetical protein